MGEIHILGAEEHNLKSVNVRIPKRALVAFTGVSGSGKSSLIFDTLYAESYRRYSDASQIPVHLMGRQTSAPGHRPKFHAIRGLPPSLGLSQRQGVAGRLSTVGTVSGVADLLRVYYAAFGEVSCRSCDIPLKAMTFSDVINSLKSRFVDRRITIFAPIAERRKGAFAEELERFRRFGFTRARLNGQMVRIDGDVGEARLDARKLNTVELVIDAFQLRPERFERAERAVAQALDLGKLIRVEADATGGSKEVQSEVYNLSSACPQCGESAPRLDPRYFSNTSIGRCEACDGTGEREEGLPGDLFPCETCGGSRLNPSMPIVRIQGKTYSEVSRMTLAHVGELAGEERASMVESSSARARAKVLDEVLRLTDVHGRLGIGHLTLGRSGSSLSPGDLQRLRLASLLANRLRGAVYVLDEPCQGLTQHEVGALAALLRTFVADGCTVVTVEHHPDFLKQCDHVFVMGPGAGAHGGEITGQYSGLEYARHHLAHIEAITSARIDGPPTRMAGTPTPAAKSRGLRFAPASLRGVNYPEIVIMPGAVNLLRGPSGRGKSSFVGFRLAPLLASLCSSPDEVLQELAEIPQSIWASGAHGAGARRDKRKPLPGSPGVTWPEGLSVKGVNIVRPGTLMRSSRRTVASALDILVPLRERFEALVSSQVLGLTASDFSWNSKKGQCTECTGKGFLEYEQKYAPPIEVTCPVCNGAKLARQSLLPRLRGRNFAEILELSLEDAAAFFAHDRQIHARLQSALEFGLGYVQLHQSLESLSGGEMQRLVLTLDLKRVRVDGFWYLLTHPGTGLHLPDIAILGHLMRRLVERGASFVLTENREEFASFADCISEF